MKNQGVAVRHDEANELTVSRIDRADDVFSDVAAIVSLGRARASFYPALTRARVAFEACFVSEKDGSFGLINERKELKGKDFALFFPIVAIGWLRHWAWDAAGVVVLVEVADEGGV